MARKKKEIMELHFLEVPKDCCVLPITRETDCESKGLQVHNPEQNSSLHFHNLMEIGICRNGKGILRFTECEMEYTKGTFACIPTNYPHMNSSFLGQPDNWEYLYFDVRNIVEELFPDAPLYANEVVQVLESKPLILNAKESLRLEIIAEQIFRESKEKRNFHHLEMQHYMQILVLELLRIHNEVPNYVEGPATTQNVVEISAAIQYIHDHMDEPIKASDLAAACNMSETHFRRIFQGYVEMPPMDYVNLIRIQKACNLMKKTDHSMESVAEQCGFTTISTFNRNFRKFLETTPHQWRINPENYRGRLNQYVMCK